MDIILFFFLSVHPTDLSRTLRTHLLNPGARCGRRTAYFVARRQADAPPRYFIWSRPPSPLLPSPTPPPHPTGKLAFYPVAVVAVGSYAREMTLTGRHRSETRRPENTSSPQKDPRFYVFSELKKKKKKIYSLGINRL